jgi:hypothetical protein
MRRKRQSQIPAKIATAMAGIQGAEASMILPNSMAPPRSFSPHTVEVSAPTLKALSELDKRGPGKAGIARFPGRGWENKKARCPGPGIEKSNS